MCNHLVDRLLSIVFSLECKKIHGTHNIFPKEVEQNYDFMNKCSNVEIIKNDYCGVKKTANEK